MLADTLQKLVNEHGFTTVLGALADQAEKDSTLAEAADDDGLAETYVFIAKRLRVLAALVESEVP